MKTDETQYSNTYAIEPTRPCCIRCRRPLADLKTALNIWPETDAARPVSYCEDCTRRVFLTDR